MTINSTETEWRYSGDGVTADFPYTNRAFATGDLRVYVGGVLQTSGFTVSGIGELAGGAVTFTTAPAAGAVVVIVLAPGGGQPIDYVENDAFPAQTHEDALDKLTVRLQRLEARLQRALIVDESAGETALAPLPGRAVRAGQALAFDADGNPLLRLWPEVFEDDAAEALRVATAARDAANTALALVGTLGAVDIPPARRLTLIAGQQEYDLGETWPAGQSDTSRYMVTIDGIDIDPAQFELAGDSARTLRLLRPVVTDPRVTTNPPELPGDVTMLVRLVASGLTAAAYSADSIYSVHLSAGSVTAPKLADAAVEYRALAPDVTGRSFEIGGGYWYFGPVWPPVGKTDEFMKEFNGQLVLRTDYPEVSALYGMATPGSTATHVALPDVGDRFICGARSGLSPLTRRAALLLQHAHGTSESNHEHPFKYTPITVDPNAWSWIAATSTGLGVRLRYFSPAELGAAGAKSGVAVSAAGDAAGGYPKNIVARFIGRVK